MVLTSSSSQLNGTATGVPNSCSYADIAVLSIDDAVFEKMSTTYNEMLYFGRYRDDCFSIWKGSVEKLNYEFIYCISVTAVSNKLRSRDL